MPEYVARVAFRSHETSTGALVVNVLHFVAAQLSGPADPQDWAGDMLGHFGTLYRNMLTTGYVLDNVTTNTVEEEGVEPGEGIAISGGQGTRAAGDTKLDAGICALLSLKTATPKKYARGRIFLPPVVDAAQLQAGGGFSGGGSYWTAVQAFRSSLDAGFSQGDTTYTPVVFSRTQLSRGFTPYHFNVVLSVASLKPHYLRSRLTSP